MVHADGRFVADLEMGGGVVRALRMARSDAAARRRGGAIAVTGKLVFPGPVVLCRSGMPLAGRGGCPATTVSVPVASPRCARRECRGTRSPTPMRRTPRMRLIPLLRGLEPELEVLPEAVFGRAARRSRSTTAS